MIFKKFTAYSWRRNLELTNFQDFLAALKTWGPTPLGAMEEGQTGFQPVFPGKASAFAEWFSSSGVDLQDIGAMQLDELGGPRDMLLLMHYHEQKVILGPYVRKRQAEKVEAMAQAMGRPVTRGEKEQVKADILAELMPKAQTRTTLTPILFTGSGLILVGAQGKPAEIALGTLRLVIDVLPVVPAAAERAVDAVLTEMAKQEMQPQDLEEPHGSKFRISQDFQLEGEDGYRCRAQGLEFDERVSELLQHAKVSHASLSYQDFTDFKIDPNARVSGIKLHQMAENLGDDDGSARAVAYVELSHVVELAEAVFKDLLGGYREGLEIDPDGEGEPIVVTKYYQKNARSVEQEDGHDEPYEDFD